ncbi:RNA polymerase II-associated protein RBA50 [Madurella mycetomatis]|uniref:RNA polymerase II-associated protein RBA50 n=1 Tax=Madurella mycetomatis TaxID=100816 RepID=A0A175WAG3_9PEZI|nr:RNA polymerase II-associated protein RBA50 [Madurella mycetomatis]
METTLEILDVRERDLDDIQPPSFPTPPAPSASGFPAHKKRVSAFKQQRQAKSTAASPAHGASSTESKETTTQPPSRNGAPSQRNTEPDEKRGIDEENKAVIDSMSPEEIAEAQKELFAGLDPKLIQMLLRRSNLDEPTGPSPFDLVPPSTSADPAPSKPPHPTVEDAPDAPPDPETSPAPPRKPNKPKKTVTFDEDAAPPAPPPSLFPAAIARAKDVEPKPDAPRTHFPQPPKVPDLDPADPDFLETMHKKFFPDLPADPSKLAWMAPLPTPHSPADRESPYYPGQSSLPVSALRFDFRGALVPPRLSRSIPVTKGLHHHGEAPEAAGYTIPELARLARSAVPAQRCVAYQTLGRMLYRLGRGDWGGGAGGRDGDEDDLAFALWRCFREGKVLESLEEEAGLPEGKGHRSCKAYATEALWLFEKGGWREKWRGL